MRSSVTNVMAAAKNCVNVSARMDAANMDQTNMGRRPQVIPGERRWVMVTRKFKPPRIEERPKVMIAMLKKIWPLAFLTLSGRGRSGRDKALNQTQHTNT